MALIASGASAQSSTFCHGTVQTCTDPELDCVAIPTSFRFGEDGLITKIESIPFTEKVFRAVELSRYQQAEGSSHRYPFHIVITGFGEEGQVLGTVHYMVRSLRINTQGPQVEDGMRRGIHQRRRMVERRRMETPTAVAAVRPVPRAVPIAKALFAVVVWGASFIATKIALPEIQPVTVVWLRFAMGVAVMGMVVAFRRQLFVPKAADLAYFTGLGFLGITFHQWLQSNGLVTAQAGTTAWIVSSTPIFMALLGWLVLRERLGWLGTAGIAVAALGVLAVVSRGDLTAVAAGRFGTPGDFLILLSAPNWAVFSVLSRKGLARHSSAGMMFWVMTTGWLLTTILFLAGRGTGDVGRLSANGWSAVAFLGIACSGLAYVFWYDALRELPASRVGAFLYLEPLVTVVVAAMLLGEPIRAIILAGGFAILLGVWMVEWRPANRPSTEFPVQEKGAL